MGGLMAETTIIDFNEAKDRQSLWSLLKRLRGRYRIEIAKYRPRRTDRQNRYYWPCFVVKFAEVLREQEPLITEYNAHCILKELFLTVEIFDEKTRKRLRYTKRSKDLDTQEFNEYLDKCAYWLADTYGIEVPEPNIYHEQLNDAA